MSYEEKKNIFLIQEEIENIRRMESMSLGGPSLFFPWLFRSFFTSKHPAAWQQTDAWPDAALCTRPTIQWGNSEQASCHSPVRMSITGVLRSVYFREPAGFTEYRLGNAKLRLPDVNVTCNLPAMGVLASCSHWMEHHNLTGLGHLMDKDYYKAGRAVVLLPPHCLF